MSNYDSAGARLLRRYATDNPQRVIWDSDRGWIDVVTLDPAPAPAAVDSGAVGSHMLPDGTCCHCGPANLSTAPRFVCDCATAAPRSVRSDPAISSIVSPAAAAAPAPARGYVDVSGRQQYAVDGPRGTFLITRKRDSDAWEVWRSDSLSTAARNRNLDRAVAIAAARAGLEAVS